MSPAMRAVSKLLSSPYLANDWTAPWTSAFASKPVGMRVTKAMTLPIELPAKAAENGPFSTSTRATTSGVIRPHFGDALVLLLPIRADSSTPSTNSSVRAEAPTPDVRVVIGDWVSPMWRWRTSTLGR